MPWALRSRGTRAKNLADATAAAAHAVATLNFRLIVTPQQAAAAPRQRGRQGCCTCLSPLESWPTARPLHQGCVLCSLMKTRRCSVLEWRAPNAPRRRRWLLVAAPTACAPPPRPCCWHLLRCSLCLHRLVVVILLYRCIMGPAWVFPKSSAALFNVGTGPQRRCFRVPPGRRNDGACTSAALVSMLQA